MIYKVLVEGKIIVTNRKNLFGVEVIEAWTPEEFECIRYQTWWSKALSTIKNILND